MIALIGFAICSVSYAQAQNTEVYRAEIPFDFSVGKKVYTAGSYRIEVRGSEQKYFVLKDARGRNSYAANSTPARGGEGARLEFHRIGEAYYLASVNASNRTSELPKASFDTRLAENTAPKKVTVVMSGDQVSGAEVK
jgi:hypothetical protein